jgi:hypothetical protein
LLGVTFCKKKLGTKPFRAYITINGKRNWLGYFPTAQEGHEAYLKAKQELHPFNTLAIA